AVQVVDAGHGLAGAAVRHDAGEALEAAMEGDELPARPVVEADASYSGSFHSNTTLPGGSSAALPAADLPSMRSKISLMAARSPSSAFAASLRAISRSIAALAPSPSSLSRRSSASSASRIGLLPASGGLSSMLMSSPLR